MEVLLKREEVDKEKLWKKIMEVGPTFEKEVAHKMPESTIATLLRSVPDDMGHNNSAFQMELGWDLFHFKFPLYDEIGMLLTNRTIKGSRQTPELAKKTEHWAVELAKDYLGCTTVSKDQAELYRCVEERQTARSLGKELKEDGIRDVKELSEMPLRRIGEDVFTDKKFNFSSKEVLRGMLDG